MNHLAMLSLGLLMLTSSCKKDWLEVKSDKSKFVPATIKDCTALLNNESFLNDGSGFIEESGADNYYTTYSLWATMAEKDRNSYLWAKDIFTDGNSLEWNNRYQRVFISNVVMETLSKIAVTEDNQNEWNTAYGTALFFRAYSFYLLAQGFAPAYDASTSDIDPGIPIRLHSDLNEASVRASVEETYQQIILDLKRALSLLPVGAVAVTKPGKPATYALLARTYLAMEAYNNAGLYADSCLKQKGDLLDYNSLRVSDAYPVPQFNKEVLLQDRTTLPGWFSTSRCRVDTSLFRSYEANDLRKSLFFLESSPGIVTYRGSYDGNFFPFTGIALDEVYLIRAECYVRNGNIDEAMEDLNTLLSHRYAYEFFTPLAAVDPEEALTKVLTERRKELIFRNLRWTDLKRLNKDPRYAKTLIRDLDGTLYTLSAGDLNYSLPVPDNVITINGMVQNIRH